MAETMYKVGEVIQFQFGLDAVTGTIIEDRGTIERGGRRLYGIEYRTDDPVVPGPYYIELGAAEITKVPGAPRVTTKGTEASVNRERLIQIENDEAGRR